ncbi:ATP synthase protein I [Clostridium tetanomorphum]|uniref:ATP synthase subunit I n=1 Tax=Clostridium tetanomorphum TaxID=1553 RepID=A0A923ECG0_CLOTT|nr:ATP synthase subunit I [Clostridium tetanomorphum]KAJ48776.1 hypothetical protein CTM_26692 [Clostridium tetanomorphum DSM 665]KAJ53262.1 hypothetical protein CTM_03189 [Clostridium tetanomorphum DSM 665]MBC2399382.1 hypothetical protein [Clostridium tetanomorphum]MBP1865706.1 ATP synthase protein I [Clostridium tetanomorphum]NRS86826.1 ATP synthase protein I [Clostridium tetanomorphum]
MYNIPNKGIGVNILAKELLIMMKRVFFYDLFIGIIVAIVSLLLISNYCFYLLLGIVTAILSFFMNSVFTNYIVTSRKESYRMLMLFNSIFRIAFICIIAILIFSFNESMVFPFLIGYSLHFLSIIVYSVSIKN